MREGRGWRLLWAGGAVLAALAIALGSLTPGGEMPDRLPWDKANHFIGYAGLAGLLGLAGVRLSLAGGFAVFYGIAIEVAQVPVPGRSGGDWADMLANGLGVASAVALLFVLRRLFPPRSDP